MDFCKPADGGIPALHLEAFGKSFVRGEIPSGTFNQILVFQFLLQMLQPGKQERTSLRLLGKQLCDEWSSHDDITLHSHVI